MARSHRLVQVVSPRSLDAYAVGIAAFRAKENDAFDAFYRSHVADVYRYSLSLVRNPIDAEDVTQATFLNAFQAFSHVAQPKTPKPWLIAIARNICRERRRQSLRRPQTAGLYDAATTSVDDFGFRAHEILSGLQGIPSRQRVVLLLHGLEGRSRSEISEELGITEATVSALLARGRHNLRLQLDQGMTCDRARQALPSLSTDALDVTDRRAVHAHLRNCDLCGRLAEQAHGRVSLLGTLWLTLNNLLWPSARVAQTVRRSGGAATACGGTLTAKAVLLATLGTLAGGITWQTAAQLGERQPTGPGSTGTVVYPIRTEGRQQLPLPAIAYSVSTFAIQDRSHSVGRAHPHGGSSPDTSSRSEGAQSQYPANPGFRIGPKTTPTSPHPIGADRRRTHSVSPELGALPEPSRQTSTGVVTAATQEVGNDRARSGSESRDGQAQGEADHGHGGKGQAIALGQQKKANDKPGGGQAGAPGQVNKSNPGPGNKASASGRQKRIGGNSSGGQARAPGQQNPPGQSNATDPPGNSGNGQADAPGQQNPPGQSNATDPPGNSGKSGNGQGNPGGHADAVS